MMFKKIEHNHVQVQQEAKKNSQSDFVYKLSSYLDNFEKSQSYDPASIVLEKLKFIKKRKPYRGQAKIESWEPTDTLGRTNLHRLAMLGDAQWLKHFCEKASKQELLCFDSLGKTPLHYAAENNQLSDILLMREDITAFLQVPDLQGNTPLHIMAKTHGFDPVLLNKISWHDFIEIINSKNNKEISVLDILSNNNNFEFKKYIAQRNKTRV